MSDGTDAVLLHCQVRKRAVWLRWYVWWQRGMQYRQLTGSTGICGQDGAICVPSLIKPALQIAYEVESQENMCEILKHLQNDT